MNPFTEPHDMVVHDSGDFVAFVPTALGFVPDNSVVMLTFDETGMSFHARVDHDPDAAGLAKALLSPALKYRIVRVVFLIYVDQSGEQVEGTAWHLRDTFVDAGIEVFDVLRVDDERWYGVLPGHHPSAYEGIPHDLGAHRFTAQSVVAGRVLFPDRAALAGSVESTGVDPGDFALGLTEAGPLSPRMIGELARDRAAERGRFTDSELSALVLSLADGHRRDQVWSHLDRSRAVQALELWRDAVRRVPDPWAHDVCAVLGFVAWLTGDGALAWCAVDRARRTSPTHSLASLVAGLLEQAQHPDHWMRWRDELLEDRGPAA